jgi:hypothetical protein
MQQNNPDPRRHPGLLGVLILIGTLVGLLYMFLVPPWQHYDEPGNFEYAWMLANQVDSPQRGQFDPQMRREVAASMLRYNFYESLEYSPNLISPIQPVDIGISQAGDLPFYYWLVSLPLRLFRYSDITQQLYLARMVSWVLFLLTLVAAYGIAYEVFPPDKQAFAWLVPVTLIFIPSFTDLMTAVNNDVGATFIFTWFLWGSIRLMRHGFRLLELVWVIFTAGVAFYTKTTVWIAVLLIPIVLLFSIFRLKRRWIVWVTVAMLITITIFFVFSWNSAASWASPQSQAGPHRMQRAEAPHGNHALNLEVSANVRSQRVLQVIPSADWQTLAGQTVTVGAWIWSSAPSRGAIGLVSSNGWEERLSVTTTTEPTFYTAQIDVPQDAGKLWFEIRAFEAESLETLRTFFDGVMLVQTTDTLTAPTNYEPDGDLNQNQHTYPNLLRNFSAEQGWFEVNYSISTYLNQKFPFNLNLVSDAFSDLPVNFWYFRSTFENINRSFWARFGWGNVPVLGEYTYLILSIVTLLGIVAAPVVLWLRRSTLSWPIVFLFVTVVAVVWAQTVLRGIGSLYGPILIPGARYAYPVIVPTVIVLLSGWILLNDVLSEHLRYPPRLGLFLYFFFLIGLQILALASIWFFYYT